MSHADDIKAWITANSNANSRSEPTHSNAHPERIEHRIAVPKTRSFVKQWVSANKSTLRYDEWVHMLDALYHGESLEERTITGMLLTQFEDFRSQLPLSQLDKWLGQLDGWKEVDCTCQSVFTSDDMLRNWVNWEQLLRKLVQDANINKRRASIVLLVKPVRDSPDSRFVDLLLEQIEALKSENDKLITKAISWGLREAVKLNHQTIQEYVHANADTLPAIAVRETQRKLATGKK